jgi:2-amino-4-hydroxy-6-hydroxymethyldihydropteridine diphosphokinase
VWNIPYLNIAVAGETDLTPEALLRQVKAVERRIGRSTVPAGLWAPREIDIDILAYGEYEIKMDNLNIPHCGLLERDFALLPFAEVEPNWRYPVKGAFYHKTMYELAQKFQDKKTAVRLLDQVGAPHDVHAH